MQISKCKIKIRNRRAFTLIEALVVLFIVSIILTTFYAVFTSGTRYIIDSKNRLGATSLANQKMEVIRNISYADIGTTSGVPQGVLEADYRENVNAVNYHVKIDVSYVDDPFDSTIDLSDVVPTDYKVARVTILWGEESASQRVYLVSNFVPPGVETSAGGGTLRINVIDTPAVGLSNVAVNISSADNGINISTVTDSSGTVLRPGMPAGDDYVVSVSKADYESVTTLPVSPDSNFDPVADQNALVIEGSLNIKSIVIDLTADIKIITEDPFGNSIADISFNLNGGRLLGNNISSGLPGVLEYNFNQDLSVNEDGEENINGLSPGLYTFTPDEDITEYTFFEMDPNDDVSLNKFIVDPGVDSDVKAIFLNNSLDSLCVSISNQLTGALIEGAEVKLKNISLGYEASLITDKFGKVYFPEDGVALAKGSYELSIEAVGFDTNDSMVDIDGLAVSSVELTPQ
ncbi:MAG: prepilin-type N-terminal cleavage/methylation domain-containing protein [Candidatus Moranbacteria bacterium]|nr:prepilin-type N-terminal cleavage/methylation domain-containing protein [Candidatus Moranbacteria bacterium]